MNRRAWLLFAVVSLLWGLPYLFIKTAVAEFSPWALVWLRCLVAAALLLPLAIRSRVLGQLRGRLGPLVLLAIFEVTAPFTLIAAGEQHITSSLTGLLVAAMPLFLAVLAIWFDPSERVHGRRLFGLLVGIVGVAWLLGIDVRGDRDALLGAGMVLAAALCYAGVALLVKRSFSGVSALASSAMCVTINAVMLTPLGLVGLPAGMPSPTVISAIIALGLLCTGAALLAYYALIAVAGASRAAVITYVTPVVTVALGVAVLDEPLTVATVVGFLLILAGSWLSTGGTIPAGLLRGRTRRLRGTPSIPDAETASVGSTRAE